MYLLPHPTALQSSALKTYSYPLLLILTGLLIGCAGQPSGEGPEPAAPVQPRDPHSYARPDEARITHLDLDLSVDFSRKLIHGEAVYHIANNQAAEIILDTKGLEIEEVTIGEKDKKTPFELGDLHPVLGRPLHIPIGPLTNKVRVRYRTTPQSDALQWLDPVQTGGRIHPFLYTQGQAILARTWLPIQDSPGIRFTYHATVRVPKDLMAVMSATNPTGRSADGVYRFEMDKPIPAYLIALAAGDLSFAATGERTGVYAEPGLLAKAQYEFADMEKMLHAAEALYGPYLWDRYDLLVLPPSFPFGGMENPKLTFATPTIIAGDRSLTSLIAHELAHSWSGNLVTNATWNDFWLNEGFTVYFERRIMESIYGKDYAEMLAQLGYQDLLRTVSELGDTSEDTKLELHLDGRDPDDGMNDIAYEKGYFLLRRIEEEVGRERFDAFLKKYFQAYAFTSINTPSFESYVQEQLLKDQTLSFKLSSWIHSPGIPPNCPVPKSKAFERVENQLAVLLDRKDPRKISTDRWSAHEWLHFIRLLPAAADTRFYELLDQSYNFSNSGNAEILSAWLEKSIYAGYLRPIEPKLQQFLSTVGRRKFLTPLYKALKETDNMQLARTIYRNARPNYHHVARNTLDQLLEWEQ